MTADTYLYALGDLHAARSAVSHGRARSSQEVAARQRTLRELDSRLVAQRDRLAELATDLRSPLPADAFTPAPVEPLPWPSGGADAAAHLGTADAAVTEARRLGRLPQLLPTWSSQFARAIIVYLTFTLPVISLVSVTSSIHANEALKIWFAVVWPLVTAIGGGLLVARLSRPRLEPSESEQVLTRLKPVRHYPWLGVLFAWGSWLITGWFFDQLAAGIIPG